MRDEVVLITGGSSGIGLAAARLFAQRGARVWIAARDPQRLADAAASLPPSVRSAAADVTDPSSLRNLAGVIRQEEDRLDLLVNSAGQFELAPLEESAEGLAEHLLRVNYLGTLHAVAATLPLLRKGSRRSIVNLSTWAGKFTPPFFGAYSASKFALNAYSHALRQELRAEGFHIGLVLPGPVDTPMIENRLRTPMYPLPLGVPVVTPDRVARAILRCVLRRRAELVVPRAFSPVLRLATAFPLLVDLVYRRLR